MHSVPYGKNLLRLVIFLGFTMTTIVLWTHRESHYHISKFLSKQCWNLVRSRSAKCDHHNYIFGQQIDQADPCLVASFKEKYLIPPPPSPPENQNENTASANIVDKLPTNIEKLKWVEEILIKNPNPQLQVKKGFYIECGANDGDFISPTIRLEKVHNWTGLLIEANPIPFQSLIKKKRNAYAVNAAACISPHPQPITFYTNPKSTGLSSLNKREQYGVSVNVTVQCIPLYTMLAALEIDTVDYLSLDVEGLELAVLKTLPFDKVTIRVMTVEYWDRTGGHQALKDFLEPHGYKFVKLLSDSLTRDALFVHKSLYERAMSIKI